MDWSLLEKEINTSTAAIMQKKATGRSPLLNVSNNISSNVAMDSDVNTSAFQTSLSQSALESNDAEYLKTLLNRQQMKIDHLEKTMNSIIQSTNEDKLNHSKANMLLRRDMDMTNRTLLTRVIAVEEKLVEYFDENSHIDTKYASKENVLQVLETSMNEIQKLHQSSDAHYKKSNQLYALVKSILYGFTELVPSLTPSGSISDIDESILHNTDNSYSKQSKQTRIDMLLQSISAGQTDSVVYEPIINVMQDAVMDVLTTQGNSIKQEVVNAVQPMVIESRLQSEERAQAMHHNLTTQMSNLTAKIEGGVLQAQQVQSYVDQNLSILRQTVAKTQMSLDNFMISIDGAVMNCAGGASNADGVDGSYVGDVSGIVYYPTRHELYQSMQQIQQQIKQLVSLVHTNQYQTNQIQHKHEAEVDGVRDKFSSEIGELAKNMEEIERNTKNCVTGNHLTAAIAKIKQSIDIIAEKQTEIEIQLSGTNHSKESSVEYRKAIAQEIQDLSVRQQSAHAFMKNIEEQMQVVKGECSDLVNDRMNKVENIALDLETNMKNYCIELDTMSRKETDAFIRKVSSELIEQIDNLKEKQSNSIKITQCDENMEAKYSKTAASLDDNLKNIKAQIGLLDSTFDDRVCKIASHTKDIDCLKNEVAKVRALLECEPLAKMNELQNQWLETEKSIQMVEKKYQSLVNKAEIMGKCEESGKSVSNSPVHHKSSRIEVAMDTLQTELCEMDEIVNHLMKDKLASHSKQFQDLARKLEELSGYVHDTVGTSLQDIENDMMRLKEQGCNVARACSVRIKAIAVSSQASIKNYPSGSGTSTDKSTDRPPPPPPLLPTPGMPKSMKVASHLETETKGGDCDSDAMDYMDTNFSSDEESDHSVQNVRIFSSDDTENNTGTVSGEPEVKFSTSKHEDNNSVVMALKQLSAPETPPNHAEPSVLDSGSRIPGPGGRIGRHMALVRTLQMPPDLPPSVEPSPKAQSSKDVAVNETLDATSDFESGEGDEDNSFDPEDSFIEVSMDESADNDGTSSNQQNQHQSGGGTTLSPDAMSANKVIDGLSLTQGGCSGTSSSSPSRGRTLLPKFGSALLANTLSHLNPPVNEAKEPATTENIAEVEARSMMPSSSDSGKISSDSENEAMLGFTLNETSSKPASERNMNENNEKQDNDWDDSDEGEHNDVIPAKEASLKPSDIMSHAVSSSSNSCKSIAEQPTNTENDNTTANRIMTSGSLLSQKKHPFSTASVSTNSVSSKWLAVSNSGVSSGSIAGDLPSPTGLSDEFGGNKPALTRALTTSALVSDYNSSTRPSKNSSNRITAGTTGEHSKLDDSESDVESVSSHSSDSTTDSDSYKIGSVGSHKQVTGTKVMRPHEPEEGVTLEALAISATKEAALRTMSSNPCCAQKNDFKSIPGGIREGRVQRSNSFNAPATSTMQCPHCIKRIYRSDLTDHLEVCEVRREVCRYGCGAKVLYIKMEQHRNVCPNVKKDD